MFLLVSATMAGMTQNDSDALERLGDTVRNRRLALKFKHAKDLAEAVEISPRVLYDIEGGVRRAGSATYSALENHLKWTPGSIREVLAGGAPTPLEESLLDESVYNTTSEPTTVADAQQHLHELQVRLADATVAVFAAQAAMSQLRADVDEARFRLHVLMTLDAEAETEGVQNVYPLGREQLADAARDVGGLSRGQKRRLDAEQAGEPPADDPDDLEPR